MKRRTKLSFAVLAVFVFVIAGGSTVSAIAGGSSIGYGCHQEYHRLFGQVTWSVWAETRAWVDLTHRKANFDIDINAYEAACPATLYQLIGALVPAQYKVFYMLGYPVVIEGHVTYAKVTTQTSLGYFKSKVFINSDSMGHWDMPTGVPTSTTWSRYVSTASSKTILHLKGYIVLKIRIGFGVSVPFYYENYDWNLVATAAASHVADPM